MLEIIIAQNAVFTARKWPQNSRMTLNHDIQKLLKTLNPRFHKLTSIVTQFIHKILLRKRWDYLVQLIPDQKLLQSHKIIISSIYAKPARTFLTHSTANLIHPTATISFPVSIEYRDSVDLFGVGCLAVGAVVGGGWGVLVLHLVVGG